MYLYPGIESIVKPYIENYPTFPIWCSEDDFVVWIRDDVSLARDFDPKWYRVTRIQGLKISELSVRELSPEVVTKRRDYCEEDCDHYNQNWNTCRASAKPTCTALLKRIQSGIEPCPHRLLAGFTEELAGV